MTTPFAPNYVSPKDADISLVVPMRWDPDHSEWVWPERLPAELSWFRPEPYLDTLHILGFGTPNPEGQRLYALAH